MTHFDGWAGAYDGCSLQPLYDAAHRAVLDTVSRCAVRPHSILDVGCGTGRLLRNTGDLFPRAVLVGVDLSLGMLTAIPRRANEGSQFVCGAAEELPFGDAVFDLILSTISLRHWIDPLAGIVQIHRVLTHGGRLVIATVVEMGRRHPRHAVPAITSSGLAAAGLTIDDIRKVAGFGPVPALTIVTARRCVETTPDALDVPAARAIESVADLSR